MVVGIRERGQTGQDAQMLNANDIEKSKDPRFSQSLIKMPQHAQSLTVGRMYLQN